MRKLICALFLIPLLFGCSDDSKMGLLNISEKMMNGEELTSGEGCIVSSLVSNVVDKHNFQTYAATFDVLARAFLSQKAIELNGCTTLVKRDKSGKETYGEAKQCPAFMWELKNEELTKLNRRVIAIVNASSDFENSALYIAFGSCVDKT